MNEAILLHVNFLAFNIMSLQHSNVMKTLNHQAIKQMQNPVLLILDKNNQITGASPDRKIACDDNYGIIDVK